MRLFFPMKAALTFAYISVLSSVGERLAARLRSQLFSAYLHRDMAFFDSHKTGELIDRYTAEEQISQPDCGVWCHRHNCVSTAVWPAHHRHRCLVSGVMAVDGQSV